MPDCFVTQLPSDTIETLRQDLLDKGFEITQPQYTIFQAKKKGVHVTLYTSLKLTVQGKDMREFIEFYLEPEILKAPLYTHKETLALLNHSLEPKIGSDEAGKGDYFGPLVVSSVYASSSDDIQWLIESGIKDSKRISDAVVQTLARKIQKRLAHETLVLRPEKYNELYEKFTNLNDLLAWAHATTITTLAQRTSAQKALVDKFANEWVLAKMLKKKGASELGIAIEQRVRAEEDVVVAAASILARARFLEELRKLGDTIGVALPKGASQYVVHTARSIVKKYSPDILFHLAKWHFATTREAVASTSTAASADE